jgi:hypothetical protein
MLSPVRVYAKSSAQGSAGRRGLSVPSPPPYCCPYPCPYCTLPLLTTTAATSGRRPSSSRGLSVQMAPRGPLGANGFSGLGTHELGTQELGAHLAPRDLAAAEDVGSDLRAGAGRGAREARAARAGGSRCHGPLEPFSASDRGPDCTSERRPGQRDGTHDGRPRERRGARRRGGCRQHGVRDAACPISMG